MELIRRIQLKFSYLITSTQLLFTSISKATKRLFCHPFNRKIYPLSNLPIYTNIHYKWISKFYFRYDAHLYTDIYIQISFILIENLLWRQRNKNFLRKINLMNRIHFLLLRLDEWEPHFKRGAENKSVSLISHSNFILLSNYCGFVKKSQVFLLNLL